MFNLESLQIKNRNAKEGESESSAIVCWLISSITNDGLRRAALDRWDKNISNRPHVSDVTLGQTVTHSRFTIKFFIVKPSDVVVVA